MINEERRKAAEWFRNRAKHCPMPATRRMFEIATEALEEPSNQVGEWGSHGECPFCGYLRQWEEDNYCGNCGAKMKGADNE